MFILPSLYLSNELLCSVKLSPWSVPCLHFNSGLWMEQNMFASISNGISTSPCNTLYVISLSKEFSHSVRQLLAFFSSSQMDCMIPFSVGKYSRSSERRIGSHWSSMSISVVVSQSHSSACSADMMDSARSYLRQPLFLRLDPSLSLFQGFLSCILASVPHIINCYVFTRPTSSAFGRAIMYSW